VLDVAAGAGGQTIAAAKRVGFAGYVLALPPPLPGQPGPFSLGGDSVLEEVYRRAGFREVRAQIVPSPLRLSSAAECVRFVRESIGALHQMLSGLPESERGTVWEEIERSYASSRERTDSRVRARWSWGRVSNRTASRRTSEKSLRTNVARRGALRTSAVQSSRDPT
jgi:hypothetical protein